MTDGELREAAAKILGRPGLTEGPDTYYLDALSWVTAGALLELCAQRKTDVTVDTGIDKHLDNGVFGPPEGFKRVRYGDVAAETVIEACVMALIDQHPPGCPHCGLEHWEDD